MSTDALMWTIIALAFLVVLACMGLAAIVVWLARNWR